MISLIKQIMNPNNKPPPRALKASVVWLGALALTVAAGSASADAWQGSRQLCCQTEMDGRAQEICRSIERHLVFSCCGHAIVSPGFRASWATVKTVWCEQAIAPADLVALRALARKKDWRLAAAAGDLLRLLTGHDEYGAPESQASIFHPANPAYLLKDACASQDAG